MTAFVSLTLMVGAGLTVAWIGAVGSTRYADDNTCPAAGSGTLASPYCKIQDAICASVSGDTVSVAAGTYLESVRMKPGVSVISQGGAAVTTINAAGQPCTDVNYCTKIAGNRCSTVLFGSGHTTATRLDGFTITGGAGREQTSPPHVAGGGIFVFSSATIVNNVITNNVLAGSQREFKGGGVYVALGAPVISNNTISGNRAVPAPGVTGAVTYGYGGGIFVGFSSDPIITSNIISGNQAGDPNVTFSLGGGGGIVVWPGDLTHAGPLIDRNLISDNSADNLGGGVSLNSLPGTGALVAVTNNVIVGNTSFQNAGGVYTYFNRSNIINNTITGNTAFYGGGIYSGQSDATLPITITNNIIDGNRLLQFGNGGGLYTFDLSTTFDPVIQNNEFWDNDKNHVAGDKSDAMVIGTNGNIAQNPVFVNKAARDYHLDPNSPAIDRGTTTLAPPVDKDNFPRGFDGNGIPNNPVAGDIDIGAYEKHGACTPTTEVCDNQDNNCNGQIDEGLGSTTCGVGACQVTVQNCVGGSTQTCTPGAPGTEVCDGLDNNCNGTTDEGFPDNDLDSIKDCLDSDDDNDGANDLVDCLPMDTTAFGMPSDVSNLDVTGNTPNFITYDTQNIGSGTRYEILSGFVGRIAAVSGFAEDFCVAPGSSSGTWQDQRPLPPAGQAWFYMIRARNACGNGTLGSPGADQPRGANACPSSIVDLDNDGSPSDLDCNDSNPARSPINPEICDNIDNDCDNLVDDGNPGGGVACGSSVGQCQPGATTCTGGSITCVGGVGPAAEICDGLDNDCNTVADDGFPNTDGDAQANCVDPDDDNDGALDAADCAPLDGTAFGQPVEVQDIDVLDGAPTNIIWTNQAIGSGTQYFLASGQISLTGTVSFPAAACLGSTPSSPATDTRSAPAPDTTWFYLVRSRNACGQGTFGSAASDTIPTCP